MKSTPKTRKLRLGGAKRMVRDTGPLIGMLTVIFWLIDGLHDGRWNPTWWLGAGLLTLLASAAFGYIKNPVFAKKTDSEPEP